MSFSATTRVLASILGVASTTLAEVPTFSRDVRPILSDNCFKCHGPDEEAREGELRLDEREAALLGGESGKPTIVPGKPEESELLKRLHTTDPDEVMPPPSMKKVLTAEQIRILEKWIAGGAKYEKHWAFQAPVKPPVPAGATHPIDAFLRAKLAEAGLEPSPEAGKPALLRRVSFDLTGLPPSPDELAAFLADPAPDAYEKAVDRLIASPRYGERWARKWLDLARYADTNGYEKDRPRTIWPYRDWVIKALNADMPFDQFSVEQLAGDLLPGATTDQLIATGFHRNTMINEEGGIDPLEFRYHAMTDRVATTGATWLGLTLQCCQCHTHKYDPILHTEYFSIMAFLNNADEPELELPDANQERQAAERAARAERLLADLPQQWPVDEGQVVWTTPVAAVTAEPAEAVRTLDDHSLLFPMPGPEASAATVRFADLKGRFTRLRVEALADDSLPAKGPGRAPNGNFVLSELEVLVAGKAVKLVRPAAAAQQPNYTVDHAIDGNPGTGWAVDTGGPDLHSDKSATFEFESPLDVADNVTVIVRQAHGSHHTIGRLRLSFGADAAPIPDREARRQELLARAFDEWLTRERTRTASWQPVAPTKASSNLPLLTIQPDSTVFVSGDITKADTYQLEFNQLPAAITAIRLEALPDPRLPARGPGMAYYEGPKGDFLLGEFQLSAGGQQVKIASASHSYAKNHFGPHAQAQLAIDGNPETGWSCAEGQGRAHEAVFRLEQPLTAADLKLTLMFGRHYACSLGKFRISFTTATGEIVASPLSDEAQRLLHRPDPSAAEIQTLRNEFLLNAPQLAANRAEIERLRNPAPGLTTLVLHERPAENPRVTRLHHRGEWTQPKDPVEAGTPAILNPFPAGEPKNRLGFARWLVSRDHPLTARVVVNRTWATFFGTGIVKTQEDFGLQSDLPSHPELLDWLAIRFMDDGWSNKKLHRLIVTSAAYKQSSRSTAAGEEKDSANRLLWRGPRLRLDAEEIRDSALRAAGLLSEKMYGPSVFPPQPASVTSEGAYGALAWTASTGEDRYRRSLYTFAKRTAPFAFGNTFDAPTGDICIVRRDKSNTPLQALSLLNDVTMMEAAQALGSRLAAQPGTPEQKITDAFLRCFSRGPDAAETAAVLDFQRKQEQRLTTAPDSAKSLAGPGPDDTALARATWTAVARALMNMDEFVTKS